MLWFCFKILRTDIHLLQLVVKVGQILRVSSPMLGPSGLTVFAILAFFPLLCTLGSLLPQDPHMCLQAPGELYPVHFTFRSQLKSVLSRETSLNTLSSPMLLQSILSFSSDLLMIWNDILAYVLVCLRPEGYILMRSAVYKPGLLSPRTTAGSRWPPEK